MRDDEEKKAIKRKFSFARLVPVEDDDKEETRKPSFLTLLLLF